MNIIEVNFKLGSKRVTAPELYQWDYGQILKLDGLELPDSYEVHFSNAPDGGHAEVRIGDETGVCIPDKLLTTGDSIFAFVFLHAENNDGETVYVVQIPVKKRPKPLYANPSFTQQTVIAEAIAALTNALEKSAMNADNAEASAGDAAIYAEAAETYSISASESAEAASNSAVDAGTYKDQASASAESASAKADEASASASSAADFAQDALTSEWNAAQSAASAAASATAAENAEHNVQSTITAALAEAKASGDFKGDKGDMGTMFIPSISSDGVLSWSNDAGVPNPAPVDMVTVICNALPIADGGAF